MVAPCPDSRRRGWGETLAEEGLDPGAAVPVLLAPEEGGGVALALLHPRLAEGVDPGEGAGQGSGGHPELEERADGVGPHRGEGEAEAGAARRHEPGPGPRTEGPE